MKKSIFALTMFLLAFSFYIISPANLVLADNGEQDPNFELIQDDQVPNDADHPEITPEGETARLFLDETQEEAEERLRQEEDRIDPLALEGGDEDKDEGNRSMH